MKEKKLVPKLRFPGFTEPWEQRKVKDIAFKRGKISEADLPYVEFEDINSGIGTLNKNILQKVGHKKGILFEAGDVLFGKLRPYLQNWLLCQFMGIAVGDFWVFQPQIVSSAFLYYLIQSEAYQSVANISSGTKMPRSSWSLVSETRFSIPKYKEATMIGEFFTSIDKNITLHQRKLEHLKLKKKDQFKRIETNTLVYNPMNITIGSIDIYTGRFPIAVSGYYVSIVYDKTLDTDFLKEILLLPSSLKMYKNYATGSLIERQRVQYHTFSKLQFLFPTLEEQRTIGRLFKSLNLIITLHQEESFLHKYML